MFKIFPEGKMLAIEGFGEHVGARNLLAAALQYEVEQAISGLGRNPHACAET